MEVEEVSEKKAQKGSTGSASEKPPSAKKPRKFQISDDDDFATPTLRKGLVDASPNKKLKNESGKGVARKIADDIDEDDDQTVKSNSKSAGRGRGAKGSAVTQITVESMDVDKSDAEEDMDDKDAKPTKPGGRGRGGRGAPAGGRGRGGGGRGGFMNFGERKDPPHKGEKVWKLRKCECLVLNITC